MSNTGKVDSTVVSLWCQTLERWAAPWCRCEDSADLWALHRLWSSSRCLPSFENLEHKTIRLSWGLSSQLLAALISSAVLAKYVFRLFWILCVSMNNCAKWLEISGTDSCVMERKNPSSANVLCPALKRCSSFPVCDDRPWRLTPALLCYGWLCSLVSLVSSVTARTCVRQVQSWVCLPCEQLKAV